jgi:hypothetical protein
MEVRYNDGFVGLVAPRRIALDVLSNWHTLICSRASDIPTLVQYAQVYVTTVHTPD